MATKPVPLTLAAGLNISDTQYFAQGRYVSADKVRFVNGLPQKIGGWVQWNSPGDELPNIARSFMSWLDHSFNLWHAFGTSSRLWVFDQNKTRTNITPFVATGTLTNPISTFNGLKTVNITHVNHGLVVGQYVTFSGATAVGGITISGEYVVTEVIDANNYRIDSAIAASSTAGPGGGASVAYSYELAYGNVNPSTGGGYGLGAYGAGTYGTIRPAATYFQQPRFWSLDKYGQYLIAMPTGGALYQWNVGVASRAAKVTNSPTGLFAFVTSERINVVLGADGILMQVKWSDDDDNTVWTPAANNTANSRILQDGSYLVAGARLSYQANMIWSDTSAILMQWTASNSVYSTRTVGRDCGLVGPGAFVVVEGRAYWMSGSNFFTYSGSVQPIPNVDDIKDIFTRLAPQGRVKTTCFHNPVFNEIWWHVPLMNGPDADGGTLENNAYVVLNLNDWSWTTGTMDRTVCGKVDISSSSTILGVDPEGVIYQHETGNDADDAALDWWVETSFMDVDEGESTVRIDGYIPDFKTILGDVTIRLTGKEYPDDPANLFVEDTVFAPTDGIVDLRQDARIMKIRLQQTGVVGGTFSLGRQRIEVGTTGKRRGPKNA